MFTEVKNECKKGADFVGDQKYKFLKLTPITDADLKTYEDAIDFIFKNEDIRNVAISGPYGAGKSSIIESYKKKNEEYKYLHISLSRFNPTEIVEKDTGEERDPAQVQVSIQGTLGLTPTP